MNDFLDYHVILISPQKKKVPLTRRFLFLLGRHTGVMDKDLGPQTPMVRAFGGVDLRAFIPFRKDPAFLQALIYGLLCQNHWEFGNFEKDRLNCFKFPANQTSLSAKSSMWYGY